MKVNIKLGKYVIAVSGGVDSIVLLNLLSKQLNIKLIVAHFDHGIRNDSQEDRRFVQTLSKKYGLQFEFTNGNLGKGVSENIARKARYEFLNKVVVKHGCDGIITAHHQDDVLETIIMNLLRGTYRKGLSSLTSNDEVIRPMLGIPKSDILNYANKNKLIWHEDSTNLSTDYFRNWVRHKIVPKLSSSQRQHLLNIQTKSQQLNIEVDSILDKFISKDYSLNRKAVIMLPHSLAKELIAHWLRRNGIADFDSVMVEKLVIDAKTFAAGKKTSIKKNAYALYSKKDIVIKQNKSN